MPLCASWPAFISAAYLCCRQVLSLLTGCHLPAGTSLEKLSYTSRKKSRSSRTTPRCFHLCWKNRRIRGWLQLKGIGHFARARHVAASPCAFPFALCLLLRLEVTRSTLCGGLGTARCPPAASRQLPVASGHQPVCPRHGWHLSAQLIFQPLPNFAQKGMFLLTSCVYATGRM